MTPYGRHHRGRTGTQAAQEAAGGDESAGDVPVEGADGDEAQEGES